MSDIAQHPVGSWSPRDYIFAPGDHVLIRETKEPRIVIRQRDNELRVAAVEVVPGSSTEFVCHLLAEPVSIFDVMRPRGRDRRARLPGRGRA